MALIDISAADRLIDLRKARGFSPEDLAEDIARSNANAPWGQRGAVNAHTIRRIERQGHVPGVRIQFVLAAYFGMRPDEFWVAGKAREAVAA